MPENKKRPSPYGSRKFESIEEYHAFYPAPVREKLAQIHAIIRKAAPEASQVISYNMPAFKMNKVLVYYAAHAKHIGLYPTPSPIKAFEVELRNYQTSKGAIQFPFDQPLPEKLIREIVQFRMEEDATVRKRIGKKSE